MRKEEIIAITNEKLVKQLGIEQLEWFRKKLYKYRRRDLLFFDIEFHLLSELENVSADTAGRYIYEETEEDRELKNKL